VDCGRQEGADPNNEVQDGYTCRVCKQVQEESGHNQPISSQEPSLSDPEPIEGEYMPLSTPHTSDVFVSSWLYYRVLECSCRKMSFIYSPLKFFQTCMNSFFLLNTKEDILNNMG